MKIIKTLLLSVAVMFAQTEPQSFEIINQPTHIKQNKYVEKWPDLHAFFDDSVKSLEEYITSHPVHDGAMNLLAQRYRLSGKLDEAEEWIEKAIEINQENDMHYFQNAMINYYYLKEASNPISRWINHSKVKAQYEKAILIDSTVFEYNYYLIYSLRQTPAFFGGDIEEALNMANAGIKRDDPRFYVIRADIYRKMEFNEKALIDYDLSLQNGVFKSSSFLYAGYLALEMRETERAKLYFETRLLIHPNNPNSFDCMGDYYLAVDDRELAIEYFQKAISIDPEFESSREKLENLLRGE